MVAVGCSMKRLPISCRGAPARHSESSWSAVIHIREGPLGMPPPEPFVTFWQVARSLFRISVKWLKNSTAAVRAIA